MSTISNKPSVQSFTQAGASQAAAPTTQKAKAEDAAGVDAGAVGGVLTSLGSALKKAAPNVGGLARTGSFVGGTAAAAGIVPAVQTANKDVRTALKEKSENNLNTAFGSVAAVGSTALSGTSSAVDAASFIAKRSAQNAAKKAALAATPSLTPKNATIQAKKAVKKASIKTGLAKKGVKIPASRAGKTTRKAAKAAEYAAKTALKGSKLAVVAKTFGRFAPGIAIGIAGFDTIAMKSTLSDPKASKAKKIASVITAGGSWLAATSIPFVAQGGAIVSGISAFAGSFF